MKTLNLLLTITLIGLISACTKENTPIEKPFSLNGTWDMKSMYSDSLGNLFFNHWGDEISEISGDSIISKTNAGFTRFGHCKFDFKDTSINYSPWPGINYSMVGNKFALRYTKVLSFNEKGEPKLTDFDAFGKSVITIVNA